MRSKSRRRLGHTLLLGTLVALAVVLVEVDASALTQTAGDPSDAPAATAGKTDLRSVTWDEGGTNTTLTISVDESVDGNSQPASLGVHVLLDTDRDGLADYEVMGVRNADGQKMDMTLRSLSRTNSTAECQDLSGAAVGPTQTVSTSISNNLETFSVTLESGSITSLSHFRWAAFGQNPPLSSPSPWDYLPDAVNPDPTALNPGDRRCGSSKEGIALDMAAGIDLNTASPPMCFGKAATEVGTNGDDVINGTAGPDVLVGLDGHDTIRGFGGNDRICGAGGIDLLLGGGGDDHIDGGAGNETGMFAIAGRAGSDTLLGGGGRDAILGGKGADVIKGGGGNDAGRVRTLDEGLRGGPGADKIYGDEGGDLLVSRDGVPGNDYVDEGPGAGRCDADKRDTLTNCEIVTRH
jgi:Ca2+-binding RTX toxin-like protein